MALEMPPIHTSYESFSRFHVLHARAALQISIGFEPLQNLYIFFARIAAVFFSCAATNGDNIGFILGQASPRSRVSQ